ncbi:MAG TPA: hypothetical protein VGY58_07905, partial [Gemmataceae bacterium]|nr:hypothetical protein [Gemmataceae bacterium]
ALKIVKGVLHATHKLREPKVYMIMNRGKQPRVLLVEHPVRPDWKLVQPERPAERSRETYRFRLAVPAGKSSKLEVIEERALQERYALASIADNQLQIYVSGAVASPAVKAAMSKALTLKDAAVNSQRLLAQQTSALDDILTDQNRLRANLKAVPTNSAAYGRYLDKFDKQETEIEKLQAQYKPLQAEVKAHQAAYEKFLSELTVD